MLAVAESDHTVRVILADDQNQEVLCFEEVHGDDGDNDGSLDEDASMIISRIPHAFVPFKAEYSYQKDHA